MQVLAPSRECFRTTFVYSLVISEINCTNLASKLVQVNSITQDQYN